MLRIGQIEGTATADKKYTDGSVAGGIAATRLRAGAFNAIQEELAHIVEEAGLTLDVNDMTQVLTGLRKLFLSRANPLADIKSDGAAAVAAALANLGLKEAAKLGVATNAEMATGTATNLLPTVAAVMSLFSKRTWSISDYIRIPDVPGGLIIQWGTMGVADANGLCTANYPIEFPSGPLITTPPAYYNASRGNITTTVASTTNTQIRAFASFANTNAAAAGAPLRYLIIGF